MGGFKRPKPRPLPAAQDATLAIWAKDARTGDPIAGAMVDCLSLDAPLDGVTNQDGYFAMQLATGREHVVEVHAPGFLSDTHSIFLVGNHDEPFPLQPEARAVFVAGQQGHLEAGHSPIFRVGGRAWRWIGVDAFALPLLFAAGADIDPYLDWAIASGFVILRCFFGLHYIAQQMGRAPWLATPDETRAFLIKMAARKIRVEWTVGDLQMLHPPSLRNWYDGQIDVLKDFTELTVAETCNEAFKNGVDPGAIGRFGHGILQSSGVYTAPFTPQFDWANTHVPRDQEWPRKAKELYDLFVGFEPDLPGGLRIPIVSDERIGADEVLKDGSRSNVPNDFFDDAVVSGLMGAGLTHHATHGIFGQTPGPIQQRCAEATIAGANAIPDDVALGQYTRGGLSDSPLEHDDAKALRTFARIQGGCATCIAVRPTNGWQAIARNGWQIESQSGPDGRVVVLSR